MTNPIAALQSDYKIFCDESCHLPHDSSNIMVFGALRCDAEAVKQVAYEIRKLRIAFNYHQELKWTKLIGSQIPFYAALIDLFANNEKLRFKATIVMNKCDLNHDRYNAGSHNTFYYKMAYYALRDFLKPNKVFRLYLDYMDTHGGEKAATLARVLNYGSPESKVYAHIIRSHESQLIQLVDLLIGAVTYANRSDIEKNSQVKNQIISLIESKLRQRCTDNSPPWADKFNLFMFTPRKDV